MKTLTILLFSTMLCCAVSAQTFINQKDPFSGKQVKAAVVMLGGVFKNIGQTFGFAETDGKKYISFMWMPNMSGANVDGLNFDTFDMKKCSLLLKLDDNSIIKFKADSAMSKKNGSGQSATLSISAYISNVQLDILTSHTITTLRLGLTDDNIGIDLPFMTEKTRKQIQKAATFMLN